METESKLLEAARGMNKEALVEIFDLYSPLLHRYALHLCGDPLIADHIVGDIFTRLLDHFASGTGPKFNLRSYLYEMAYHSVVDEFHYSRQCEPLEVVDFRPSDRQAALIGFENRILIKKVFEAVRNDLTDNQRHVIILRFLEGMSLEETATLMRKNVIHVKVIQNRAIAKLRQVLEYGSSKLSTVATTKTALIT